MLRRFSGRTNVHLASSRRFPSSSLFLPTLRSSSTRPAFATALVLAGASLGALAGSGVNTGGLTGAGRRFFWRPPLFAEEQAKEQDKDGDKSSLLSKLPSVSLPSIPLPDVSSTLSSWRSSLTSLTSTLSALQSELSLGPDSTYGRIIAEGKDPAVHPELQFDASVRLGTEIGLSERAYLRNRREGMREAFARLMEVPVEEVDVRDLPVVAIAASGGGYRAMLNTIGSLGAAKEEGLWDCVSLISGVSGSCWALNVLYSIGGGQIDWTIQHLRERVKEPFLQPETITTLLNIDDQRAKDLLSAVILKESSKGGEISLVDAYGTLVSTRLYSPSPSLPPPPTPPSLRALKTSTQRTLLDLGQNPLPIYCTVRHDLPSPSTISEAREKGESKAEIAAKGEYTWFETTPYEVGSDKLGAWIPTWALGRLFEGGRSTERVPELGLPVLSGIYASAFCATLFSYFQEIKPVLSGLPGFETVNNFIHSNAHHLHSIHPFPPAELPNFLFHLPPHLLPSSIPPSLTELPTLGFADAGMELNIPYVPLMRRQADVIVALDASADSQERWFTRAGEYAKLYAQQEGGVARWPQVNVEALFPALDGEGGREGEKAKSEKAAGKVDEAKRQEKVSGGKEKEERKGVRTRNPEPVPLGSAPESRKEEGDKTRKKKEEEDERLGLREKGGGGVGEKPMPESNGAREPPLSRCSIWIGSTSPSHSTSCRIPNDSPTLADVQERDGIALAYIPLRGDDAFPDPLEVFSTWRFEYGEDETDRLLRLAGDNFRAGAPHLKTLIKGVWLRKQKQRLDEEARERAVDSRGL
ncbi:hypothetical protein JCM8547_007486 [Rhodosporidiobolus lusitaniae]